MSDAENTTREKIKAALNEVLYDGSGGSIGGDPQNWKPYVEEVTNAVMAILTTEPNETTGTHCAVCGCTVSPHGASNGDLWWAHDDGTDDHVANPSAVLAVVSKMLPRCKFRSRVRIEGGMNPAQPGDA